MSIDRRQFNQGVVAAAVAAAIPALPIPPQVEARTSRYLWRVPIDDLPFPEFEVTLLERSAHTELYEVRNLTDLILRIEGRSRWNGVKERVYLFELYPGSTYQAFIPAHWQPEFRLVEQYRWGPYAPCDCDDGPHGTWCSNRNVLRQA